MDKLYYFPLYVRKILSSNRIAKMSGDAFKAYMMLLCSSWLEDERATLSKSLAELQALSRATDQQWATIKDEVLACFVEAPNGRIGSEFLMEIGRQQENKQQAGSRGGSTKQANLKQNEQQTASSRVQSKSKSQSKSLELEKKRAGSISSELLPFHLIAVQFHDAQAEKHKKESTLHGKNRLATDVAGAEVLEKLHRIDGWVVTDIEKLLLWVLEDEFWSMNIRSLRAIRDRARNGSKKIENALASMKSVPRSTAELIEEAQHD